MSDIKKSYDLIIVGAGTAGTTAARFAAKAGLDVCLIDSKKKDVIGNKICGDACGTDIFEMLKISEPKKGEDLLNTLKGFKIFAPNMETVVTVNDRNQTGFVVDRLKFGQRLLNEALDSGVNQLLDDTTVIDLLYKNGTVFGVKVTYKGKRVDLNAKIVIDASGVHSTLRRNIKSDVIEHNLADTDSVLCYREIVELTNPDDTVMFPDYISILKDNKKSPDGIIWYFPRDDHSINLGLGISHQYCKQKKGILKENYKKYVIDQFIGKKEYKILSSAGMIDPLRRPLWSCAENGIMFAGDAAFHVNPIDGGGIDPSMKAGYYAANNALVAIEKGDASLNSLWGYNRDIMTNFGSDNAALDIQKPFYRSISNEEQNFILEKGLLTGDEFAEITIHGTINLSPMKLVSKVFKGVSKPGLMLKFNYLRTQANKIKKHYKQFPKSMDGFEEWKQKAQQIYKKVYLKFS